VAASALARYYLGDWKAVNVAVHGEFTNKKTGKDNATRENLFGAAVDVAF